MHLIQVYFPIAEGRLTERDLMAVRLPVCIWQEMLAIAAAPAVKVSTKDFRDEVSRVLKEHGWAVSTA